MSLAKQYIYEQRSITPLITFRILFGAIMAISIFRFWYKGWIHDLYIKPNYFFTFYGFDWIKPLGENGMYFIFFSLFITAICIVLGLFYRIAAPIFFLLFTYVEFIDKTNYLNHYYFVSLVSFLLILVPVHKYFSLDSLREPSILQKTVPAWMISIFMLQLSFVYIFAGIAKLNSEWLINAMPLKLWLPALTSTPIIGKLFQYEWAAYLFSWSGALYDCLIVFLLMINRTRIYAYAAVVVFHLMTATLFQIGMFPYIMILCTLIFFPSSFHDNIYSKISTFFGLNMDKNPPITNSLKLNKFILLFLSFFFFIQILLPFRFLAYPGNLYWTEQGYRFSWRVMLMEKAGHTNFMIKDISDGKTEWVNNMDHLTPQQEKMMSTQPDMILQYAHHLESVYKKKGFKNPEITCKSKVTLNGRRSQTLVDPEIDLTKMKRGWKHKKWILPQSEN